MKSLRIAVLACVFASLGCDDGYIVASEQTVFLLTKVDDKPLPVPLTGTQNSTATVTYGILAGGPKTSECEYRLQIEAAANIYRPAGRVPQCSISKGGRIFIRIDLGSPIVSEPHDYLFEY